MNIEKTSDYFHTSKQISIDDVEKLKQLGYKAIICNRPDFEEPSQPTHDEIQKACSKHAIEFKYIPVSGTIDRHQVELANDFIKQCNKPILAYCRTGTRSRTLFSML